MASPDQDPNDTIERRLGLMRFWLFGVFVLFFAGIVMVFGLITVGDIWLALTHSAPIWLMVGILCVVVYYGYKFYLEWQARRK